jgi:hypothetical protein
MDERRNNIDRLCDEIREDNWILRTLGALLTGEDYLQYLKGDIDGQGIYYRDGLQGILDCYVERQEQRIAEIQLQNANSPRDCIKEANAVCSVVILQRMDRYDALKLIDERLKELFAAILEYGLSNGGGEAISALYNLTDLKAVLQKITDDVWNEKFLSNESVRQKAAACLDKEGAYMRITPGGTAPEIQEPDPPPDQCFGCPG